MVSNSFDWATHRASKFRNAVSMSNGRTRLGGKGPPARSTRWIGRVKSVSAVLERCEADVDKRGKNTFRPQLRPFAWCSKTIGGRQEEPRGDTNQKTRAPGTDRERLAPDREASLRNSVAEQVQSERMAAERHLEVCPEDRHEHVSHGTWVGSPFRIRRALPIMGVEQERNDEDQWPAGVDASDRRVHVLPEEHGNDHGDDQDQQTRGRTAPAERAPPPDAEGASCHEPGDRGARSEGAPPTEARSQAFTGSRRQVEGIKNVPRQDPARRTGDDLGKPTYNEVDRVGPVGVGSS